MTRILSVLLMIAVAAVVVPAGAEDAGLSLIHI